MAGKSASERTRKQRTYNRRDKAARAQAALADAQDQQVSIIVHELSLKQLDAIPETDRDSAWESQREVAQAALDSHDRAVKATLSAAEALNGKPLTTQEKRNRDKAVAAARVSVLESNLDSWEDSKASHERNLDRLDSVPPTQRDDWRGDIRGLPGGELTWDQAYDQNEDALDQLDRAATAATDVLAAERAKT